jgi:hypothetical protein
MEAIGGGFFYIVVVAVIIFTAIWFIRSRK